jgi:ATP-dependent RNA helicase DOB1
MDPVENMQVRDDNFKELLRKLEVLESRLLSNPLHGSPLLPSLWDQYHAKVKLSDQIKEKKKAIGKAHQITQMEELKARKRVLKRLAFINDDDVVQLKARVACELSSTEGHELLLAELLFERFFNDMSPELTAAVLSCFVFDEKIKANPLPETLDKPYREIVAKARHIVKVSQESKLDMEEDEYLDRIKPQLMETVMKWTQGSSFAEIW